MEQSKIVARYCCHSCMKHFCRYGKSCRNIRSGYLIVFSNSLVSPQMPKLAESTRSDIIYRGYCNHSKESECEYGCGFKFHSRTEEKFFEDTGYFKYGVRRYHTYKYEKCEHLLKYGYCKFGDFGCKFSHKIGKLQLSFPLPCMDINIHIRERVLIDETDYQFINKFKYTGVVCTKDGNSFFTIDEDRYKSFGVAGIMREKILGFSTKVYERYESLYTIYKLFRDIFPDDILDVISKNIGFDFISYITNLISNINLSIFSETITLGDGIRV